MKPVPDSVARITNDGLGLILGERTYGQEAQKADYFGRLKEMNVPKALDALSDVLVKNSKLLALADQSDRSLIYAAYGLDLDMMRRYRDGFKLTIDAAVLARADSRHEDAQAFLKRVTEEISGIVHEPTMNLGPEALKLERSALLVALQEQFRQDVESLKQGVAIWLHVLAESDYLSVIEWFNTDALRYHFFRMDSARDVDRKVTRTGNVIQGRTTTTETKTKTEIFSERRSHTVINARRNSLGEYQARVPKRIGGLIDTIPPEVRQFVTIIDGTVSQEEVTRRLTSRKVETDVKSVYVPDPALALFDTWAINGWGGTTAEAARSTYKDHPLRKADKVLLGSIAAAVVAVLLAALEGSRAAALVAGVAAILIFFSQLGMRIDKRQS
jgi:hypothetical protein